MTDIRNRMDAEPLAPFWRFLPLRAVFALIVIGFALGAFAEDVAQEESAAKWFLYVIGPDFFELPISDASEDECIAISRALADHHGEGFAAICAPDSGAEA